MPATSPPTSRWLLSRPAATSPSPPNGTRPPGAPTPPSAKTSGSPPTACAERSWPWSTTPPRAGRQGPTRSCGASASTPPRSPPTAGLGGAERSRPSSSPWPWAGSSTTSGRSAFIVTNIPTGGHEQFDTAMQVEAWFRGRTDIEDRFKDAKIGAALRHLPSATGRERCLDVGRAARGEPVRPPASPRRPGRTTAARTAGGYAANCSASPPASSPTPAASSYACHPDARRCSRSPRQTTSTAHRGLTHPLPTASPTRNSRKQPDHVRFISALTNRQAPTNMINTQSEDQLTLTR